MIICASDGSTSSTGFGGGVLHNGTTASGMEWWTYLRIDSSGRVRTPVQPAFKCKLSSATGANFTGVLVFNSVQYNIGSHYNSSNGRFTAPVDGRYLFCWYTNMERAGGNGSFYADWMINGNNFVIECIHTILVHGNRFVAQLFLI